MWFWGLKAWVLELCKFLGRGVAFRVFGKDKGFWLELEVYVKGCEVSGVGCLGGNTRGASMTIRRRWRRSSTCQWSWIHASS